MARERAAEVADYVRTRDLERLALQQAEGISAGRALPFARRVQPEPLSTPSRETTALNPEAAALVKSEWRIDEVAPLTKRAAQLRPRFEAPVSTLVGCRRSAAFPRSRRWRIACAGSWRLPSRRGRDAARSPRHLIATVALWLPRVEYVRACRAFAPHFPDADRIQQVTDHLLRGNPNAYDRLCPRCVCRQSPAAAQTWQEYSYPDYAFTVAFPANPRIENTTYQVADNRSVPARVYRSASDHIVFKVTVADLANAGLDEKSVIDHAIKTLSAAAR